MPEVNSNVLTEHEISRYNEAGFLTAQWRLPDDLLARIRGTVGRLIAANPHIRPEQLAVPHVPGGAGGNIRSDQTLRDELLACAHAPEILGRLEQLIGPDIMLWSSQVFHKPPSDGMAVPWHQDGEYWPLRPHANCTVWIALDPSTRENGCLRVIPGSHRNGLLPHSRSENKELALDAAIDLSTLDESSAIDVELQPGEISFHDVFLVHGSEANRSPKPRSAFAIRYMPATTLYDRSVPDYVTNNGMVMHWADRPIYLVRGRNRHPENRCQVWEQAEPEVQQGETLNEAKR